ncbi:hypothetical protein BJG89_10545 [Staphylococcus nepalensis]|uniref:hypothetical protein n=1 Tax=Staphylococcus nepalensis TaxID=214473 RepID=UPI000BC2DFFE|nr:hypothetical protein [Staphylococcus nepalensis]ATH60687.1 hypothetical protein BJD96_10445 [Staphylococcus nepalensis]ATH65734.1 hypothetical protein BJG89_10545 [Staphylococcus nepalensis]
MAYEYEESNKQIVFTVDNESSMDELNERIKELEEVYRKAKAFNEILKIDNQATDEDKLTGQYESDIETVLSEYMERVDDER